jgi:hypothetical protein
MTTISSRKGTTSNSLTFDDLTDAELELISALVYNVRLGKGSIYREAAYDLMNKIESFKQDDDYISRASALVDPECDVLDSHGTPAFTIRNQDYEVVV